MVVEEVGCLQQKAEGVVEGEVEAAGVDVRGSVKTDWQMSWFLGLFVLLHGLLLQTHNIVQLNLCRQRDVIHRLHVCIVENINTTFTGTNEVRVQPEGQLRWRCVAYKIMHFTG